MRKYVVCVGAMVVFILGLSSFSYALKLKSGYAVEDEQSNDQLSYIGDSVPTHLYRTVIDIPQEYGKIIATYPDPAGVVFWFETGDGQVRQLLVEEVLKGPIVIHRSGKLE